MNTPNKKSRKEKNNKVFAKNKSALWDFKIIDRFEAGMVLEGWEVKSIRAGRVNLTGNYVISKQNKVLLTGMQINALDTTSTHVQTDPQRTRQLLLTKSQIKNLNKHIERKGHTCVCLNIHLQRSWIKAEIALVSGKQKYEKRTLLKERDITRELQRELRTNANRKGSF